MKNFAIHFFYALCLNIIFTTHLLSNPSIDWTGGPMPGEHRFSIDQLPTHATNAFWILGDGHFRTGLAPSHYLGTNNNNYVQAYLLSPYRPVPPIKLTCGTCTNPVPASPTLQNPRVFMAPLQSVKVGTSWNPTRGQEHYTILTFENVTGLTDGVVHITFDNTVSTLEVDTLDNNSTWFTGLTNANNHIRFEFAGLQQGEQRHVLIKTEMLSNIMSNQINYIVQMTSKIGDLYYYDTPSSDIRRYPHDPNNKEVSESMICAHNNEAITLEYRIDFQNEGEDYARTVRLKDYLPNHLDYSSFQLVSSSDLCQVNRTQADLEIMFYDIDLPGLNQVYPYIPHPNETTGFVIFTIETETCLDEMVIENEAAIYFDSLQAIYTPIAATEVLYTDYCYVHNISCEVLNDDGIEIPDPPSMNLTINNNNVEIYPNPIGDLFSIDFELFDNAASEPPMLAIYNTHGLMVANLSDRINKEKGKQHMSIDASNWPNGIYFVKLEDTNQTHTWKIIKIQE